MDLSDLSDDQLVDLGASVEKELATVRAELPMLSRAVDEEGSRLRMPAVKLGAGALVGLGGVMAAPVTFGWSLVLTLGSAALLTWDIVDFGAAYGRFRPTKKRLKQLRVRSQELAEELRAIELELGSR